MLEPRHRPEATSKSILLVVSILVLLTSIGPSDASAYYALPKESQTTVGPAAVLLQNGTVGTCTIYTNSTSAKVGVSGYGYEHDYDYVLRVNNTDADSWKIRLQKYADSSIGRLQNCTIYFRNATNANSTQLVIENGSFNQIEGPWWNLGSFETMYLVMTVQVNSTGTSRVSVYLEVLIPNTTAYAQYLIAFEIT